MKSPGLNGTCMYIEPWFPAFAQPSSTQHIPTLAPENIPSHKSALGWSKISGHPVDGQLMAVILSQLFGMTL